MWRKSRNLHPEEHFPTPRWSPTFKANSLKIPYQVIVVQSNVETTTKFLLSCLVSEGFIPGGGVSCAKPGGQNGRSCVHSRGTGTVWLLCACGSVSSTHLNGRTSTCSLPTCTCRVSHLYIGREKKRQSVKKLEKDDINVLSTACVWIKTLTGVCPAVCFEVGALGVHFVAAIEVAAVNSPLFQCVRRLGRERMLCARMNYYWRVVTPKRDTQRVEYLLEFLASSVFIWFDQERASVPCNSHFLDAVEM